MQDAVKRRRSSPSGLNCAEASEHRRRQQDRPVRRALTRVHSPTTQHKARHGGPSVLLVQVNRDVRGCAFLLHDHVVLRLVDD